MSDLVDLAADEELREWDAWLMKATDRYLRRNDPGWHDLLQEGRIAFWKEFRKNYDDEENRVRYALHKARLYMGDVINPERAEQPTGRVRAAKEVETSFSVDALETPDTLLGFIEALEGVEWAYHHGEIMQALRSLPERHREYVHARFWEGLGDSEIARKLGRTRYDLIWNWKKHIRPHLAESLGHLQGV